MSRIGNAPITIPAGVTVEVSKGGAFGHQQVVVTGNNGSLTESIRPGINVEVNEGVVNLTRKDNQKQNKAYHGLYRALVRNMVEGVSTGYTKQLDIVGIGYRAEMQGNKIVLSLGYAHKIELVPPAGVTISVENQTEIKVSGADRQKVGEIADKIRSFRKPEPYKGKGVRYHNEVVRRKSVKQA